MHDDDVFPHKHAIDNIKPLQDKQDSGNDMFIDSIAIALQGETMGMHKVRIVSLSPKAVSKQDGIVMVPEETACSETSVNKKTSSVSRREEKEETSVQDLDIFDKKRQGKDCGEELVEEKKEKEDMDRKGINMIELEMEKILKRRLEQEEVEERSIGWEEKTTGRIALRKVRDTLYLKQCLKLNNASLQDLDLPSGLRLRQIFRYASGKLYANICPQATLKGIFKKYLPLGYASGKLYANICPQAMLAGNASGKIFVKSKNFEIFKMIAAGYAPGYASGKFQKNIYPQGMLGATPPAKFFVIFEEIAPGYAFTSFG
ncbi:hypothetical protein T07_26 [Trichinella nelsoni]|uniref:Uncharacterized protein n=1 Tax=Trichinella nelsoni TaxID=6336 RepID=A0A0V0S5J1_9BILA|nr:hypothetical protein T07_26 [Trichinella nelsoni]